MISAKELSSFRNHPNLEKVLSSLRPNIIIDGISVGFTDDPTEYESILERWLKSNPTISKRTFKCASFILDDHCNCREVIEKIETEGTLLVTELFKEAILIKWLAAHGFNWRVLRDSKVTNSTKQYTYDYKRKYHFHIEISW